MVRHDNLFPQIIELENFYAAFTDCSHKKKYNSKLMRLSSRIECIITDIIRGFCDGTWQPGKYYEFECRTEVKRRAISAPGFRDGIAHHAVDRIVRPLFEKKYIYDLYSNRKGKGQHRAARRVQSFVRRAANKGTVYVLQCDIHNYYGSIDHEILKEQMKETIKDEKVLDIIYKIIDSFNDDTGKGVPIGALPSQTFANVNMMQFDHYMKESLHIKNYVRFMDDFIIVGNSKAELHRILGEVKWYIETQLKLTLNPKTKIFPGSRGVDFAGYRLFIDHMLPRKRNVKGAKIRFKELSFLYRHGKIDIEDVTPRVQSFLGYMEHCKAKETTKSTLRYLVLRRRNEEKE